MTVIQYGPSSGDEDWGHSAFNFTLRTATIPETTSEPTDSTPAAAQTKPDESLYPSEEEADALCRASWSLGALMARYVYQTECIQLHDSSHGALTHTPTSNSWAVHRFAVSLIFDFSNIGKPEDFTALMLNEVILSFFEHVEVTLVVFGLSWLHSALSGAYLSGGVEPLLLHLHSKRPGLVSGLLSFYLVMWIFVLLGKAWIITDMEVGGR
ncbi:hypothetical protein QBC34DRAFT_402713 [Podospora aff. communis PSN243]|uniref:Uncharacterized protein n=1 Tax=Podospora aff. communis PSN243 TaxID=3040156 RepID=A0AAV9GQC0_9PEZI|nr:hypothetical protein QBC34DRAFT_402713 [Podospora aff. communis PSN243]